MSSFQEMQEFVKQEASTLELNLLKFSVWHTENNNTNIDILVEKADLSATNLDDCSKINKLALLWLKNANLLGKVNLCVRVPGLDRELFSAQDFARFIEEQVQIELKEAIEGNRKRIKGFIKFVKCDVITLESNSNIIEVDFDLIEKASIIPNWDKIMKRARIKE